MIVWTFSGEAIYNTDGSNSTNWEGRIVESGKVKVEFVAKGRYGQIASEIGVVARQGSGWDWEPNNGITIQQGGMSWPASSSKVGLVCRAGEPCPLDEESGWIVQPYESFGDGNGYVMAEVPGSGPNAGAWYIDAVSVDLKMNAIINPDYLAGGTSYPATGGDAVACDFSSSDTVMVGFTDYNEECRDQSMIPFESWAWDHEATHMVNAVTYVQQHDFPRWDPRRSLEELVSSSDLALQGLAHGLLQHLPRCVQRAAGTHGHLGGLLEGFSGIPTTTWFWGSTTFHSESPGWDMVVVG